MIRGRGLWALLEVKESIRVHRGKQVTTSESSLAPWARSATVHLTQSSLGIGHSFLLTVFYVVAERFAVEIKSVGITILVFFNFHFVEDV
jgi:hypothetical protein